MKYLILLFTLMCSVMLSGALLYDVPISVTQPDGTQLEIYASGDEFHNWLHDKDGYTIIRNEETLWYTYAERDGQNVIPGRMIAGFADPKSSTLEKGINLGESLVAEKYARSAQMRDYSNGRSPHTGQFNNLVVFIKFADDPDFMSPITYYEHMFNATGVNDNSQRNYFLHASYNQLTIDSFFYPPANGTTIVTYVDSQPRNYYRPYSQSNPIGYDVNDFDERAMREQTMLANSISYVESMVPTDLVIDGDNDGYVDNVCFIIQGSPDGWAELLWPHRWVMYYVQSFLHGKRVWDFNLQLESSLFSSGASVLSHEMFHSLGAPDLYRYSNSTITPIGQWDLMAGNANPPQHMSAWMKYRYGEWLDEVPTITESGTYTLSPVAESATNNIYRIPTWRYGESYVLEYRKGYGMYDNNLPGSGLLVYRLDTRVQGNADGPPDELYIYRPFGTNPTTNGVLSSAHMSQQVNRTRISESTSPSGFTGQNLSGGLNLYNVGMAGDNISFSVMISDIQLTYPTGGEIFFAGSNKVITWKAKSTSGNVALDYTLDGGQTWIPLVASTPNDGDFTWNNIPSITTTEANIRITLLSNNHTAICIEPFVIVSEVGPPAPVYPENGAVNVATDPQISWEPVFGATSYQFQLSTDPEFDSYVINVLNHMSTTYNVPSLQSFTTFYWRVATISDIGYSEFSPSQSFTTGEITVIPGTVSLISPANYANNQAVNPILQWNSASAAYTYHLQMAQNNLFTEGVMDYESIENTSFQPQDLNPNTQYFWRVRGSNPAGYGYFSGIRRFTTGEWVSNDDQFVGTPRLHLAQNFPNPFNPSTTISFGVRELNKHVALKIYNTKGQLVKTLYSGTADRHEYHLVWNGTDESGASISSGVYFYRLHTDESTLTRKMLLIQ